MFDAYVPQNPNDVHIVFNGTHKCVNFNKVECEKIEEEADITSSYDGYSEVTFNASDIYLVTLELKDSSPTKALMNTYLKNRTRFIMSIVDNSTVGDRFLGTQCIITKRSTLVKVKGDRPVHTYIIKCSYGILETLGGAPEVI